MKNAVIRVFAIVLSLLILVNVLTIGVSALRTDSYGCFHESICKIVAKMATSEAHGNVSCWKCLNCSFFSLKADPFIPIEESEIIVHYYAPDLEYVLNDSNNEMLFSEATCQSGNVYFKKCSICDVYSTTETYEDNLRAPHEPSTDWIVPKGADCTKASFNRIKTCAVCGETLFSERIEKRASHGETVEWPKQPATCTTPGREAGMFCSNCFQPVVGGEEIPPLPHNIVVAVKGYPSTCYMEGLTDATTCTTCNTQYTPAIVIPKIPHTIGIPATCVSGAICGVCGEEFGDTDSNNHTKLRIIGQNVESTCSDYGVFAAKKCDACGIDIPSTRMEKKPHTVGTPANCVDEAICSVCKKPFGDGIKDPNNHKKIVTDKAKPATCIATGLTEGSHCEACGKTFQAQTTVPLIAHSPKMENKPATCTEPGVLNKSVCSVCYAVLDPGTVLPATGHKWGDWTALAGYSCEVGGTVTRSCVTCRLKETATKKAGEHDLVIDEAVPSTCSTAGKTEGTHCRLCNSVIKSQDDLPLLPHKLVPKEVIPPTCSERGYTIGLCTVCGSESQYQFVDKLNHSWGNWKIFKSTNEDDPGIEVRFCSVCGAYELREAKPQPRETTDKPSDEQQPEKDLNFFQRIIEWFRNIFAKLFGKK